MKAPTPHKGRKKLCASLLLLIFICLSSALLIFSRVLPLSHSLKYPAGRVVLAYKLKDWLNPYWENEFSRQCEQVKDLDLNSRLEFFVFIAKICDFDSYRGIIFRDALGDDRAAFLVKLENAISTSNPSDAEYLRRIKFWVMD